jgi:uncharacterized membrane protein
MIVSVLAVCFLLFIGLVAYFGYKLVINRGTSPEEINTERCSICRERFQKGELILRQIGDYKLLFFCRKCIDGLNLEAKGKQ